MVSVGPAANKPQAGPKPKPVPWKADITWAQPAGIGDFKVRTTGYTESDGSIVMNFVFTNEKDGQILNQTISLVLPPGTPRDVMNKLHANATEAANDLAS